MTTNTNMTIYNKYTEPFTHNVVFKKHLIDYVFWDDTKAVKQNDGYDKDNKINVYVPKDINNLSEYIKAKNYNGTGWTIQDGDFIIKGDVPINEVSGIKELSQYETFIIKSFSDKDYGSENMHHFEIKGD
jgi:hypothetical protein